MPTMSAPATPASSTADPRTAPAETKSDSTPAVSAQPKSKKGILVIGIIAAACFVLVAVGILAAILLFGQESPAPKPQTDPAPVPADSSNSNTPSSVLITDMTKHDANEAAQVTPGGASAVIISRNNEQTPSEVQPGPAAPSVDTPSVPEEMVSDPLGKKQIVLLADTSAVSRKTKGILAEAFGADKVSFQEAEGMGSYKQLLKTIIKSDPTIVVLCFAQQYAEDGISASGYGNVIGYHADQFQENGIPFMFIQPADDEDNARIRAFRDATTDLCQQRSIPFIDGAT